MYAYIERVTIRHDKLKYRQHLTYNFIKMRLLRGIQQNGKKRKKKKGLSGNYGSRKLLIEIIPRMNLKLSGIQYVRNTQPK